MVARTISRWECPQCNSTAKPCGCSYSGGHVEVWYVEKGAYLKTLSEIVTNGGTLGAVKSIARAALKDGAE